MARTRAGVQNAQSAELASGIELCEPLGNRRRNAVEMTCVEEFRPLPQLRHAIAPRSRLASPLAQEIDVTLSGEVETMSVSADERAGRSGQWPRRGWGDDTMPLHQREEQETGHDRQTPLRAWLR